MKTIKLGKSNLEVPKVAVGCMRLTTLSDAKASEFLNLAIEENGNFFDHSNFYSDGECEEKFSRVLKMNDDLREKVIIQTKCGLRKGRYDFSTDHILESVDGSLKRLKTDYVDVLLLHRPDALADPQEVAKAFDILHSSGKVKNFGVSNHNPMQIQLLKKYVKQDIVTNQLQLSLTNCRMISQGLNVNMLNEHSVNRDGSVLDFCRLNDITIQPWSPFQYGYFEGVFLNNDKFPELNAKIDEIASKYDVTNTTITLAWLLKHPAKMQPVIGTMNKKRLVDCLKASEIEITREEWYELYRAAGNPMP